MPLDSRIPLGAVTQNSGPDFQPLQTIGAMMQIKEKQRAFEEQRQQDEMHRRDMEDDDLIRTTLSSSERPEDGIETLRKAGAFRPMQKLATQVHNQRKGELEEQGKKLDVHEKILSFAAQNLDPVNDDASYQVWRKAFLPQLETVYGSGANDMLPTVFDPAKKAALMKAGTSRVEQINQTKALLASHVTAMDAGYMSRSDFAKLHPDIPLSEGASEWSTNGLTAQRMHTENLSNVLRVAPNKEAWDAGLKAAFEAGQPRSVMDKFGVWGPGANERARQLGLTTAQATTDKNAEDREKRQEQRDAKTDAQTAVTNSRAERTLAVTEAREARMAGAGTAGGPDALDTGPSRVAEKNRRVEEDKETETWVKKQPGVPGQFSYEALKGEKLAGVRNEYIARRVRTHDQSRQRTGGSAATMEEAAAAAAAKGDVAGYEKIRAEYDAVTNGVGSLTDIVPEPSPHRGLKTPAAQAARLARTNAIADELRKPDLTPRAKARLLREKKELDALQR